MKKEGVNKQQKYSIIAGGKRYTYELHVLDEENMRVICPAANIDQNFLNEDIPVLLVDLPELILAEKAHKKNRGEVIRFRISTQDKKIIEKKATQCGFPSVSSYIRALAMESDYFEEPGQMDVSVNTVEMTHDINLNRSPYFSTSHDLSSTDPEHSETKKH